MNLCRLIAAALLCVFVAPVSAQAPLLVTEKIEWTWTDRPESPLPGLPNVLLVGDSITRAYYPAVSSELKGVANVYLFATSASSGDPRLPRQLDDYFNMIAVNFAVIHFNNGMHGWGYSEQQYAGGLTGMVEALRAGAPQAKLIWADTTPVRKEVLDSGASNARIDERNRLAAEFMSREKMTREKIPIDDQHGLMLKHSDLHSDDVHYSDQGSALQARQAAAAIRSALSKM